MQLQVKELQKADAKACCLHDDFNNEKQLVEGKDSIVNGLPEVPWSWHHKDNKLSQTSIH